MLERLTWDWAAFAAALGVIYLAMFSAALVRRLWRVAFGWRRSGHWSPAGPSVQAALELLRQPIRVPGTEDWIRYDCRIVACDPPRELGPAPVIAPARGTAAR